MMNTHPQEEWAASPPKISVAILVGERVDRAAQALQSVLTQAGIEAAEILLVDGHPERDHPLPGTEHPQVRVLGPLEGAFYGELRALAVREARGEIVAFLEEHSLALPGWLRGIMEAFEAPVAGAGGACYPANLGVGWSDAVGALTYGRWSPPLETGAAELVPGNNSAYLRSALLVHEDQLEDLLTCDTLLQWRLRASGQGLVLVEVGFAHRNEAAADEALASVFHYHRCFAEIRARLFGWSLAWRLGYLLLTPLIPWLRWGRALLSARAGLAGPVRLTAVDWIRVLVLLHAAVAGQALGLVAGSGSSETGLVEMELNAARPGLDLRWIETAASSPAAAQNDETIS